MHGGKTRQMPKVHSREDLYRFMWQHVDYRGKLSISQGEVASGFGISYQQLSVAVSEFIGLGMIHKTGHEFTLLYEPDKIPWGPKFKKLRRNYLLSLKKTEDGDR